MRARLLHHHHRAFDAVTRSAILAARAPAATVSLAGLARLGREISLTYAVALNEALLGAGVPADELAAVAAHGQTLYHAPPMTIQWIDPALLAAEAGCAVVSDFRRADCAAGGQGAPLVPFADWILFRDTEQSRVLVNIGGIANLTYLRARGSIDEVIAFDTGPGNCISDAIVRDRGDAGSNQYDDGGSLALSGRAVTALVDEMVHGDYFLAEPPKSTDVPTMLDAYEAARRLAGEASMSIADELATACQITARSIVQAAFTMDAVPKYAAELIVSGGGSRNQAIMQALRRELDKLGEGRRPGVWIPHVRLRTTDELGVPSQAREAIAFALLGAATLDGEPSNVPSATGARRRVVLGSVTPRP
jgi:anhydro-N-acetylmuramic acid kinase